MKRFTKRNPCPICGGYDELKRGRKKRCFGFFSDDDEYAHCTRQEYAGTLPCNSNSSTFAHHIVGKCGCGVQHGAKKAEQPTQRSSGIVARYGYKDAGGKLIFEVVRREPKKFYVRHPDGAGGWVNDLKGVERVLYHLPELLTADPAEAIWIAEGERDVDNLVKLGLVATTNPGGACKWRQEYSEALRGRFVGILPDNDPIGRDHADRVARSLDGIASCVRILNLPNLPDKGDVSDWLKAGGSVSQLRELLARTPEYRLTQEIFSAPTREQVRAETKLQFRTASELAGELPEEVEWMVRPWVAAGSMTSLSGKVKAAGKTTLILHVVGAVLDGADFLGEPTCKTSVVYLTEQPAPSFKEALKGAGLLHRDDLLILTFDKAIGSCWDEIMARTLAECKRLESRLLVVDTLPQFVRLPGDSENDAGAALRAFEPLQRALANGIAVIVITHERKAGGEVSTSGRGSTAFGGVPDILLTLSRCEGNGHPNLRVIGALSRFPATPTELVIELTPNGYISRGQRRDVATEQAKEKILAYLPDNPDEAVGIEDIAIATGVSRPTAQRVLNTPEVLRVGEGTKGHPYRYYQSARISAQTTSLTEQKEMLSANRGNTELTAVRKSEIDFEEGVL